MSGSNILTVIVILIILLYAFGGLKKGFVRTLMSMLFFVLVAVVVYLANPHVSRVLKEKTPVYEIIEEKCREIFTLEHLLEESGNAEKLVEMKAEQEAFIDSLPLPAVLKEQLSANNNAAGYASLAVADFEDYIAVFMTNLVITVLTYVVTFLLAVLILKLFLLMLDVVTALPVIKGLNRLFGFLLGSVQGILVVWIFFLIITILGSTDMGNKLLAMISESSLLSFFYDSNLLLRLLLGVSGGGI